MVSNRRIGNCAYASEIRSANSSPRASHRVIGFSRFTKRRRRSCARTPAGRSPAAVDRGQRHRQFGAERLAYDQAAGDVAFDDDGGTGRQLALYVVDGGEECGEDIKMVRFRLGDAPACPSGRNFRRRRWGRGSRRGPDRHQRLPVRRRVDLRRERQIFKGCDS